MALAVLLLVLLLLLVTNGLTSGQVGEGTHAPRSAPGSGAVPRAVRDGGPIVDGSHPDRAGAEVPRRHVVLTFDDGPSKYTRQILDILDRYHVKGTFFVIGDRVTERPDLVRRMYDEGHEVGLHSYTHVNLADVSPWRVTAELNQTQLAIAAATGHVTNLLRPPYSSKVDAVTSADWRALTTAGGYRTVYATQDTQDWSRPGVSRIVAAAQPQGDRGMVVMLHDGGGDRSETVRALGPLIASLRARGYTFDTVTSAIGAPSPWAPASGTQQAAGHFTGTLSGLGRGLVWVLNVLFLLVGALGVLRTMALFGLARRHDRGLRAVGAESPTESLPPVSVVIPAYNEELGVGPAVASIAASDYPDVEIIVVDDGSTDATAERVRALDLPGVRLITQGNAGKPAALNTGIAAARHDTLVLVDADTVFEPDSLRHLVAPLTDPAVGAVSGNTKVGNRRGLLGAWQHIEYVIGFNLDRRMFDVLKCMPTVPGAIGAFRRRVLEEVGGVSDDTLAEDTDLTMATIRAGWRVVYAPRARAWTEAPASLGQLWRQRYRWCFGTMQSMWKHRRAVTERGAGGALGRRGLPYLLAFQVVLPLLAPVIDLVALYSLTFDRSPRVYLVWLAFLGLQLASGVYAFVLDREKLRPLLTLPLQQLVYRQLMYAVVIQSVASALYGLRLRWHVMHRTGDRESAPVAVP